MEEGTKEYEEWKKDFVFAFKHLDASRILYYIGKYYGFSEFNKYFQWFDTYQSEFWVNVYMIAVNAEFTPKETREWCRQALDHYYPNRKPSEDEIRFRGCGDSLLQMQKSVPSAAKGSRYVQLSLI